MIVYAISDPHGQLPEITEPHDLLLIGGDICPADNHKVAYQQQWLDTEFRQWLLRTPFDKAVGIAGNHDMVFDLEESYAPLFEPYRPPGIAPPNDLAWVYLEDSSIEYRGYKIHGTPWQPIFGHWAFNLPESDLAEKFAMIPEDTDILLSHGPPYGFGDRTDRGERVGSSSLRQRIKEVRPELVVCGHIHEARGIWHYAGATIANATVVDLMYDPVFNPMRFELSDR